MLGPVQLLAFEFDTLDRFQGDILDQLESVAPLDAVRILDVLFVAKEDNGDLVAIELGDLGVEEGDEVLGTIIGELLGFSFEDDGETGEGADLASLGIGDESALGVTVNDVRQIAADLAPGTAAGILLLEHRWAGGLRDAIFDAGGSLVLQGFLTVEGLAMVGAELIATADAIEAIEEAQALEAAAAMRSLEALATIELAAEVEAAVVARTVLGLAEAGFLDAADVAEAAAAIVGDETVDNATEGNN